MGIISKAPWNQTACLPMGLFFNRSWKFYFSGYNQNTFHLASSFFYIDGLFVSYYALLLPSTHCSCLTFSFSVLAVLVLTNNP